MSGSYVLKENADCSIDSYRNPLSLHDSIFYEDDWKKNLMVAIENKAQVLTSWIAQRDSLKDQHKINVIKENDHCHTCINSNFNQLSLNESIL